MRAHLIYRYKASQGPLTVEMVLWQLPTASEDRPHGLKYRLYCERGRTTIVRYDNEAGKGDHCHYGQRQVTYKFTSQERLLNDFRDDCARLAGWRWS